MSRKLAFALLIAAFAVTTSVVIVYAAVVNPGGNIHGCYSQSANANGDHFLFVTDTQCPAGSVTLIWNQMGPAGPQGAPGPQGPPGPAGPAPTTYMRLQTIPVGGGTLYEVFCDLNPATNQRDTATGGGANYVSRAGEAVGISGSYPIVAPATPVNGARPVGWHIDYAMYSADPTAPGSIRGGAAPGAVNAWVVCQK